MREAKKRKIDRGRERERKRVTEGIKRMREKKREIEGEIVSVEEEESERQEIATHRYERQSE